MLDKNFVKPIGFVSISIRQSDTSDLKVSFRPVTVQEKAKIG